MSKSYSGAINDLIEWAVRHPEAAQEWVRIHRDSKDFRSKSKDHNKAESRQVAELDGWEAKFDDASDEWTALVTDGSLGKLILLAGQADRASAKEG